MNCLDTYLKIFQQYPLSDTSLKKQRNNALHRWQVRKDDYPLLKSQVCAFIKENRTIINPVFIKRAVCPLMEECFAENDYTFINELIETVDTDPKIAISDLLNIYCEYIQWRKSPVEIIHEILRHIDSERLLEYKFYLMEEQIYYSVHELPIGILDFDSLSMQNYNEVFNELEEITKKLHITTDIGKIRTIYDAYVNYLNEKGEYASFEEYLITHNIDYDFIFHQ